MVRFLTRICGPAALGLAALFGGGAAQAGDAGHGRSVFLSQCSVCHSSARNGGIVVGPPLFGVVGRRAGSIPAFAYSQTMRAAGFAWTDERLRAYLPAPRQYLPGVKMTYPGLKNSRQLDDLITYLETLK